MLDFHLPWRHHTTRQSKKVQRKFKRRNNFLRTRKDFRKFICLPSIHISEQICLLEAYEKIRHFPCLHLISAKSFMAQSCISPAYPVLQLDAWFLPVSRCLSYWRLFHSLPSHCGKSFLTSNTLLQQKHTVTEMSHKSSQCWLSKGWEQKKLKKLESNRLPYNADNSPSGHKYRETRHIICADR